MQSNSGNTTISLPANYRVGDEVDFQVKAVLGYQYAYWTNFYGQTSHIQPMHVETFYYQSSDWSPTQTFIMPNISPTPTLFQSNAVLILPIAVVVLALAIGISVLLLRRHRKITKLEQ
jgi:hypothetical protein